MPSDNFAEFLKPNLLSFFQIFFIEPVCNYFKRFSVELIESRKSWFSLRWFATTLRNSSTTLDTDWSTHLFARQSNAFWPPQIRFSPGKPFLIPLFAPAWFLPRFRFLFSRATAPQSFQSLALNTLCDNRYRARLSPFAPAVNPENTVCVPESLPTMRRHRWRSPLCK